MVTIDMGQFPATCTRWEMRKELKRQGGAKNLLFNRNTLRNWCCVDLSRDVRWANTLRDTFKFALMMISSGAVLFTIFAIGFAAQGTWQSHHSSLIVFGTGMGIGGLLAGITGGFALKYFREQVTHEEIERFLAWQDGVTVIDPGGA